MPSDAVLKTMNAVHRTIQRVTGGRKGWHAFGMEVVELTTTGRRSGLPRTVLLTAPTHLGGSPVLVASRGGDDTHPAWFLNLRDRDANPEIFVKVQSGAFWSVPDILDEGPEHDRIWELLCEDRAWYRDYQKRCNRTIPLVRLPETRPA